MSNRNNSRSGSSSNSTSNALVPAQRPRDAHGRFIRLDPGEDLRILIMTGNGEQVAGGRLTDIHFLPGLGNRTTASVGFDEHVEMMDAGARANIDKNVAQRLIAAGWMIKMVPCGGHNFADRLRGFALSLCSGPEWHELGIAINDHDRGFAADVDVSAPVKNALTELRDAHDDRTRVKLCLTLVDDAAVLLSDVAKVGSGSLAWIAMGIRKWAGTP